MAFVEYRVVCQVYDQIRVLHIFSLLLWFCRNGGRGCLITAENCFYTGDQLFGIKGFDHIVICSQLQPQNLVKDFTLG
jgi:hypothetical protein